MPPPPGYVITPSDQQPIRSVNDTEEFRRNYGANEFVNALYALDSGHTGKGVEVGVIDTGVIDPTGELTGRISSKSKDFGTVTKGGVTTARNVIGDANSHHGTSVSNVIAAAANGEGEVGYAPDATIVALRIDDWNADTQTQELWHLNEAIDYATSQKIKLLNASLASGGSIGEKNALDRYATATQGLIVISAGNYQGDSPVDAAAVDDTNIKSVLFVVALDSSINAYGLAGYSNQAGTMMDRTVAAPGANVTTDENGNWEVFAGTSSAAPVVTALAADILSKWPQLTGQQSGDIIINTAKDIGDPGVDPVYGHGLVDFQAALAPINPTLSNGTATSQAAGSFMVVPGPVDSKPIAAALSSVTILDAYGRDYKASLSSMVLKPESGSSTWLRRRLAQMSSGGGQSSVGFGPYGASFGFASYRTGPEQGDVRTIMTNGSVDLQDGGTGFHAGYNAQDSLQSDIMGLAPFSDGVLAYAPQAGNSLGVDQIIGNGKIGFTMAMGSAYGTDAVAGTLSWQDRHAKIRVSFIDENGSVMGMPSEGALALGRGAVTAMIEAHRTFDLADGWSLDGYGSVGATKLKIDASSLVTGATPLIATRFGVQANHPLFGGVVSLGLAQPLTIETGEVRLTYGSGYDLANRSLIYTRTSASLASAARRMQITAGFARATPHGVLRFGLMRDTVDGSSEALAGLSTRF